MLSDHDWGRNIKKNLMLASDVVCHSLQSWQRFLRAGNKTTDPRIPSQESSHIEFFEVLILKCRLEHPGNFLPWLPGTFSFPFLLLQLFCWHGPTVNAPNVHTFMHAKVPPHFPSPRFAENLRNSDASVWRGHSFSKRSVIYKKEKKRLCPLWFTSRMLYCRNELQFRKLLWNYYFIWGSSNAMNLTRWSLIPLARSTSITLEV